MAKAAKTEYVPATPPALPQNITYEEFLALSEEYAHTEWVNGKVLWMSPVSDQHMDLVGFPAALIR